MGNRKFKLSDIIPNSWFHKLKYTSKPPKSQSLSPTTTVAVKLNNHHLPPSPPPFSTSARTTSSPPLQNPELQCQPRKSYHFTRDLPQPPPQDPPLSPPRKSKTSPKPRKPTRKNTASATVPAVAASTKSEFSSALRFQGFKSPDSDDGFPPNVENAPPKPAAPHFDIVIDVDKIQYKPSNPQLLESLSTKSYKINGFDFQLPRIITKPKQSTHEEKRAPNPVKRFSVSSPVGVRLKINSPRIMGRKQGQNGNYGGHRKSVRKRRNIAESFAVVKSSDDPQRDFKESMVEMIVQNNLRGSKDLEDLLACYLSLNSDEYHDVIIKVFKQIWYDLSELKHQKLAS